MVPVRSIAIAFWLNTQGQQLILSSSSSSRPHLPSCRVLGVSKCWVSVVQFEAAEGTRNFFIYAVPRVRLSWLSSLVWSEWGSQASSSYTFWWARANMGHECCLCLPIKCISEAATHHCITISVCIKGEETVFINLFDPGSSLYWDMSKNKTMKVYASWKSDDSIMWM